MALGRHLTSLSLHSHALTWKVQIWDLTPGDTSSFSFPSYKMINHGRLCPRAVPWAVKDWQRDLPGLGTQHQPARSPARHLSSFLAGATALQPSLTFSEWCSSGSWARPSQAQSYWLSTLYAARNPQEAFHQIDLSS